MDMDDSLFSQFIDDSLLWDLTIPTTPELDSLNSLDTWANLDNADTIFNPDPDGQTLETFSDSAHKLEHDISMTGVVEAVNEESGTMLPTLLHCNGPVSISANLEPRLVEPLMQPPNLHHGDLSDFPFECDQSRTSTSPIPEIPFPPISLPRNGVNELGESLKRSVHERFGAVASADNPSSSEVSKPVQKARKLNKGGSACSIVEARTRRARISARAREMLESQFKVNCYPSSGDCVLMAQATHLTTQTIKNWFSNTRNRTADAGSNPQGNASKNVTAGDCIPRSRGTSPMSVITKASLDALSTHSPASSNVSLERYLTTPLEDEGVSEKDVQAAIQEEVTDNDIQGSQPKAGFVLPHIRVRTQVLEKASQAINVLHSPVPSIPSNASSCSRVILDSRGTKRGRKRWSNAASDDSFGMTPPMGPILLPTETANATRDAPYFCTWPSCEAKFPRKSEWIRHEEAVHYCPHQWICCRAEGNMATLRQCFVCCKENSPISHIIEEHFVDKGGAHKSGASQPFMRKDQLISHIKRVHLKNNLTVPHELTKWWEVRSDTFKAEWLRCGFCGQTSETWKDRQNHVFRHLEEGAKKSAWWPQRLPPPTAPKFVSNKFRCPTCSKSFKDFGSAVEQHGTCISWSCRFLCSVSSSFHTCGYTSLKCRLCGEAFPFGNPDPSGLWEHAKTHTLGHCDQDMFTSKEQFLQHLCAVHSARESKLIDWPPGMDRLEAWECVQTLQWRKGKALLRTTQKYEPE